MFLAAKATAVSTKSGNDNLSAGIQGSTCWSLETILQKYFDLSSAQMSLLWSTNQGKEKSGQKWQKERKPGWYEKTNHQQKQKFKRPKHGTAPLSGHPLHCPQRARCAPQSNEGRPAPQKSPSAFRFGKSSIRSRNQGQEKNVKVSDRSDLVVCLPSVDANDDWRCPCSLVSSILQLHAPKLSDQTPGCAFKSLPSQYQPQNGQLVPFLSAVLLKKKINCLSVSGFSSKRRRVQNVLCPGITWWPRWQSAAWGWLQLQASGDLA